MKDVCSICGPFNCVCVCANCGDPADTEREKDDGTIVSLCSECDSEPTTIPCSRCGKPTTFDPTYSDLCYRCCRAANE